MKTRYALIALTVVATLALVYEISFRVCVRRWGEIDTDTEPASLYYSCYVLDKPLRIIFAPRANLPFGKAYLDEGRRLYLKGGVFYLKNIDGAVANFTEAIREQREKNGIEQPEYSPHSAESPSHDVE